MPAGGPSPVHLRILGSGTLLPDGAHGSPSHWVEGGGCRILLDCGAGAVHALAREGLPWSRLSHLVLSHFHADHMGDVPALLWALRYGVPGGRSEPLTVLGPVGLEARMRALAGAFGPWVLDPGFPLALRECDAHESIPLHPSSLPASSLHASGSVTLVTHPARHAPESLALRLEFQDPAVRVGYTGDTGPLPALETFFHGVDCLVAECGARDPVEADALHLSPRTLADLARGAAPGVLVPVHLHAELERDAVAEQLRGFGVTSEVRVGWDGLPVDLPVVRRPGVRGAEMPVIERLPDLP
jgi:ribonuclease BN (tRNA processing enzyme)